jgi:hypothetical protein
LPDPVPDPEKEDPSLVSAFLAVACNGVTALAEGVSVGTPADGGGAANGLLGKIELILRSNHENGARTPSF